MYVATVSRYSSTHATREQIWQAWLLLVCHDREPAPCALRAAFPEAPPADVHAVFEAVMAVTPAEDEVPVALSVWRRSCTLSWETSEVRFEITLTPTPTDWERQGWRDVDLRVTGPAHLVESALIRAGMPLRDNERHLLEPPRGPSFGASA